MNSWCDVYVFYDWNFFLHFSLYKYTVFVWVFFNHCVVIVFGKGCLFKKNNNFFSSHYLKLRGFFSSPSVLRKKANNLFGIQFDDAKYNKLGKLLETISERRELVSIFMCLIYVAITCNYCFEYCIGNVITFTYKVLGYTSMIFH